MAGYSTAGSCAKQVFDGLFARAIFIADVHGNSVVFCVADLMSATRYLREKLASYTIQWGIPAERIVLLGTHTHHGPGNMYGYPLYDHWAQCKPGFDEDLADWLAQRMAEAVRRAISAAEPAQIGFGTTTRWGITRNASLQAFVNNPEAGSWNSSPWPGHQAPEHLHDRQKAVDPRITVMVASRPNQAHPLAVLASFACHNTTLGMNFAGYSADWFGVATTTAQNLLATRYNIRLPIVALAAGPGADINALRDDLPQGKELLTIMGITVGGAIVEAMEQALADLREISVDVRFSEPSRLPESPQGTTEYPLSERLVFGSSTLAGGDDGHSVLYRLGLVKPGQRGDFYDIEHPQYPKIPVLGRWHTKLATWLQLSTAEQFPMHYVNLSGHAWVTLPGEPTIMTGARIEQRLLRIEGISSARVLGYANDYAGYFVTSEEYMAQAYEGASTLYGRYTEPFLAHHILTLAQAEPTTTIPIEVVEFLVAKRRQQFRQEQRK
jgi:neutral ceramidase